MAIDYASLQAEIQKELDNDYPNVIAAIPSFIHRAERRLSRILDVQDMECRASTDIMPVGTTDETLGVYPVPTDWRMHKTIEVRQGKLISLYLRKIPALSDTNTSNWLLDKADDIYLYGSLVFAESFLKNDPRIQVWSAYADTAIAELQEEDRKGRYGGGPLVSKVGSQRLFRGWQDSDQYQSRYEYIPPFDFFDMEGKGIPIFNFGYRTGVFTVAERKIRILPKPGGTESGTADWTGCATTEPPAAECCFPTVIPFGATSCLEDVPTLFVLIQDALQVVTLDAANWAVQDLFSETVYTVSTASVEQKISDPGYTDGWYVRLLLVGGPPSLAFLDVRYSGNDLLLDDGTKVCVFSGSVKAEACA